MTLDCILNHRPAIGNYRRQSIQLETHNTLKVRQQISGAIDGRHGNGVGPIEVNKVDFALCIEQ